MNLLLFVVAIVISFVVVRIGALAFQMTGLEWSLAKFQALSCFSGTGFTTKESEQITSNLQRRKIASALMVMGNAGLVTLIATFANSLNSSDTRTEKLPFLDITISAAMLPWVHLGIILAALYVIYRILSNSRLAAAMTLLIKRKMLKKGLIQPVLFEELAVATGGYGVVSIEVSGRNDLPGKTIQGARFKEMDIIILAVERGGTMLTNPKADEEIRMGDRLLCFGKIGDITKKLASDISARPSN